MRFFDITQFASTQTNLISVKRFDLPLISHFQVLCLYLPNFSGIILYVIFIPSLLLLPLGIKSLKYFSRSIYKNRREKKSLLLVFKSNMCIQKKKLLIFFFLVSSRKVFFFLPPWFSQLFGNEKSS